MKTRLLVLFAFSLIQVVAHSTPSYVASVASQATASTWVERQPGTSPPAGSVAGMTFDSARNRVVLLKNGTWEYDGLTWNQTLPSNVSPTAGPLVYDSSRQRVVSVKDGTWEYDGTTWVQRVAANASPPGGPMAYDSARRRLVLVRNGTWEYDGTTWTQKLANATPSLDYMAYDEARRRIVFFGGRFGNSRSDLTYEYDGTSWISKSPAKSAPNLEASTMVYDAEVRRIVIFGGASASSFTASASNTMWEYDGNNWVQLRPTKLPPERAVHGMAFDSTRRRLVVFGGIGQESNGNRRNLSDTWEFSRDGSTVPPGELFIISVQQVRFEALPRAFEPATLIITVRVTGLPQEHKGYIVDLLMGQDLGSSAFEYVFYTGNQSTARYMSPSELREGTFDIRISGLRIPTTIASRMAVTVKSDADLAVAGALVVPLSVAASSLGYLHCPGVLYAVIGELVTKVTPVKDLKGLGELIGLQSDLTANFLTSQIRLVSCGDNVACQEAEQKGLYEDTMLSLLDAGVSSLGPIGAAAVLGKSAILAIPEAAKCVTGVTLFLWDGVKKLWARGVEANAVMTGSPVYPLVINGAGQRAGFLPNGQIVQDIPGAEVFATGEQRYVLYSGQDEVRVEITGYATGTMNVYTAFSRGNSVGHAARYNNVPVTPRMKASLSSANPQPSLSIDSNSDGQADLNRAPDVIESGSGPEPPPTGGGNDSYTFKETGFSVSGRIWQLWQAGRSYEDSLYINGLPLTPLRPEVSSTDGKSYQTQWFERARFEVHPENQPPYDVLLGLLGVEAAKGRDNEAPFKAVGSPGGGTTWFEQTKHTLGDSSEGGRAIASYWNRLGGLQQFGYPLSQPFVERNATDGKSYLVQYFERQRFEYHPENQGTRYEVLLGRLGAEQQDQGGSGGSSGGAQPQPPGSPALAPEPQEQQLIDIIARYREGRGLPVWQTQHALTQTSRYNAQWLHDNNPNCENNVDAPDIVQRMNDLGYPVTGGRVPSACGKPNDPQVIFNDWLTSPDIAETMNSTQWSDIGCGWWPTVPVPAEDRVFVTCIVAKSSARGNSQNSSAAQRDSHWKPGLAER